MKNKIAKRAVLLVIALVVAVVLTFGRRAASERPAHNAQDTGASVAQSQGSRLSDTAGTGTESVIATSAGLPELPVFQPAGSAGSGAQAPATQSVVGNDLAPPVALTSSVDAAPGATATDLNALPALAPLATPDSNGPSGASASATGAPGLSDSLAGLPSLTALTPATPGLPAPAAVPQSPGLGNTLNASSSRSNIPGADSEGLARQPVTDLIAGPENNSPRSPAPLVMEGLPKLSELPTRKDAPSFAGEGTALRSGETPGTDALPGALASPLAPASPLTRSQSGTHASGPDTRSPSLDTLPKMPGVTEWSSSPPSPSSPSSPSSNSSNSSNSLRSPLLPSAPSARSGASGSDLPGSLSGLPGGMPGLSKPADASFRPTGVSPDSPSLPQTGPRTLGQSAPSGPSPNARGASSLPSALPGAASSPDRSLNAAKRPQETPPPAFALSSPPPAPINTQLPAAAPGNPGQPAAAPLSSGAASGLPTGPTVGHSHPAAPSGRAATPAPPVAGASPRSMAGTADSLSTVYPSGSRQPVASAPGAGQRFASGPARQHRIIDGDTLESISQRYYATPQHALDIFHANRNVLQTPDVLPLGVRLRIPSGNRAQGNATQGNGSHRRTPEVAIDVQADPFREYPPTQEHLAPRMGVRPIRQTPAPTLSPSPDAIENGMPMHLVPVPAG